MLTQHQAAVKAVAWCPWQPHVLASGGGTADRTIRLWNTSNGTLLNTIDTKSQVTTITAFFKGFGLLSDKRGLLLTNWAKWG